ncbi:MAG: protein translocase subunit SecDF [Prevotellaceae bacterium]|jgi:SecD/SecF fusion protein|nr:protein translocase subunit SecDF [Prevotellaceae bacterium]
MQSKGTIKLITVLLILACLYQLSFTWVTSRVENAAEEFATVVDENGITRVDEEKQKNYLDSIAADKVYPLGLFTYRECKEKELALGLDLKGGMNVILEISIADMVRTLANNSSDPDFQKILAAAETKYRNSGRNFLTLFEETWNEIAPDKRMASIFATYEQSKNINSSSTNKAILDFIQTQADGTIDNSFKVLRNRIDRFGVVAPNIQRVPGTGRILVELPGVKDPDRVSKLLQGTASLEFWETFDCRRDGISQYIVDSDKRIKELQDAQKALENQSNNDAATSTTETVADSTAENKDALAALDNTDEADDLLSKLGQDSTETSEQTAQELREQYPLQSILILNTDVDSRNNERLRKACVGRAHYRDTAKISQMLALPQISMMKPNNLRFLWTSKPLDAEGVYYELIAIKLNPRYGNEAPLTGEVIIDARKEFNQGNPHPYVSMSMNNAGSKIWAQLTKEAAGNDGLKRDEIAVVLDGYVYSYPSANGEIRGGNSQITGNFSVAEADDLVNVLSSGKMPAPAQIVSKAVVGPTLGQESINAGMLSFLLAFLVILIYIWLFYNVAGLAANVALIVNVFLIFGVLASFGAVLTMPGIAGIVLTLGMAVDANIIIYERIKEEYVAGKALRLAIADGYKNAYSAIIDGQLTTLITGIVLLVYGTGPVKGFATTLIIGIITSMFTSIFISRLIFEGMLNRGKNIKFGFSWSLEFLKHTKIKFIQLRKKVFTVVVVVLLAGLSVMLIKGEFGLFKKSKTVYLDWSKVFSLGVDFTGGRTYVVRFDRNITSNEVRDALFAAMGEASEVKQFGNSDQMKITTKYKYDDKSEDVDNSVDTILYEALKGLFVQGDMTFDEFVSTQTNPHGIISFEKVGPSIASDITRRAVWAVIISLFLIFVYIAGRFSQWQWGLGGVVALAGNALFTLSIFSFGTGLFPWGMDIDQTFIAAMLTIIGYSINDTVIIFDRIREYRRLYPKRELGDNINDAINATLARTLNTSATTVFVLLVIFFFGGDVIRGFAFAMTVGIVFGTFSSIFVATPVAYNLIRYKQNKKQKTVKPELLKR